MHNAEGTAGVVVGLKFIPDNILDFHVNIADFHAQGSNTRAQVRECDMGPHRPQISAVQERAHVEAQEEEDSSQEEAASVVVVIVSLLEDQFSDLEPKSWCEAWRVRPSERKVSMVSAYVPTVALKDDTVLLEDDRAVAATKLWRLHYFSIVE